MMNLLSSDDEEEEQKISIRDSQPSKTTLPPYMSNTISATKDINYFGLNTEPKRQFNNFINNIGPNKKHSSNSFHADRQPQQKDQSSVPVKAYLKQELIQPNQFKAQITNMPQTQQIKPSFINELIKLPTFPSGPFDNAPRPIPYSTDPQSPEFLRSPFDNFQAIKADFRPQILQCIQNPPTDIQHEIPSNIKEQQQDVHPDNWFLKSTFMCEGNELKTTVICDMCTNLNLDPAVCENEKCGKSYCYACFKKWVQEGTGCFNCGCKKFSKKTPPMYDDLISTVKFDCPYSKNEMPFPQCVKLAMPYKEAIEHIKTCECAVKSCENSKCQFRGMLQDLDQHRKTCEFREINCQYCKAKMDLQMIQQHQQEQCPKVALECNLCKQQFLRKDIHKHENTCPMMKVKCTCGEEIFRKDCFSHINVCPNQEEQCKKCYGNHLRRDMGDNTVYIRALSQRCAKVEYEVLGIQQDIKYIHGFIESQQKKETRITDAI